MKEYEIERAPEKIESTESGQDAAAKKMMTEVETASSLQQTDTARMSPTREEPAVIEIPAGNSPPSEVERPETEAAKLSETAPVKEPDSVIDNPADRAVKSAAKHPAVAPKEEIAGVPEKSVSTGEVSGTAEEPLAVSLNEPVVKIPETPAKPEESGSKPVEVAAEVAAKTPKEEIARVPEKSVSTGEVSGTAEEPLAVSLNEPVVKIPETPAKPEESGSKPVEVAAEVAAKTPPPEKKSPEPEPTAIGRSASIARSEDGTVKSFTAADGVTYTRVEPDEAQRQAMSERLGKPVDSTMAFWEITGGSQGKSNGHNNRTVIAEVQEADGNVKVQTKYPVEQATLYLGNGDYIHGFPEQARTMTRSFSDGGTATVTRYPDGAAPRLVINKPGEGGPLAFELDENGRIARSLGDADSKSRAERYLENAEMKDFTSQAFSTLGGNVKSDAQPVSAVEARVSDRETRTEPVDRQVPEETKVSKAPEAIVPDSKPSSLVPETRDNAEAKVGSPAKPDVRPESRAGEEALNISLNEPVVKIPEVENPVVRTAEKPSVQESTTKQPDNGSQEQASRLPEKAAPQTSDSSNIPAAEKTITHQNGFQSEVRRDESGQVNSFVAADGVRYERYQPDAQDREALKARLGEEPGKDLSFWRVEGSQAKSNGHNDKTIIAEVQEVDGNVKVQTRYPVTQATLYLANGDYIHGYPDQARSMTRTLADGGTITITRYPGDHPARMVVNMPGERGAMVYDLSADGEIVKEVSPPAARREEDPRIRSFRQEVFGNLDPSMPQDQFETRATEYARKPVTTDGRLAVPASAPVIEIPQKPETSTVTERPPEPTVNTAVRREPLPNHQKDLMDESAQRYVNNPEALIKAVEPAPLRSEPVREPVGAEKAVRPTEVETTGQDRSRTAPVSESRDQNALAIKLNEPVIEIPKAAETRSTGPEAAKIEPTRLDTGNRPVPVEPVDGTRPRVTTQPDSKAETVDLSGGQRRGEPVTPVEPVARDVKEIATRGAEVLADKPVSVSQPDIPSAKDRATTLGQPVDDSAGRRSAAVSETKVVEPVPASTVRDTTPVLRGETASTKPASEPASDLTAAKVPDRTGAAGGQEFDRTGRPQVESFAATATNTLRQIDPNRVEVATADLTARRDTERISEAIVKPEPTERTTEPAVKPAVESRVDTRLAEQSPERKEPDQIRTTPPTETRTERSGNNDALAIKLNEPVIEIPKAAETRATAPEAARVEPTRLDTGNRPVPVEPVDGTRPRVTTQPDSKAETVDLSGSQTKGDPVTPVEPLARDIREIATRGAEVLADKPVSVSQPDRPNTGDRGTTLRQPVDDSADRRSAAVSETKVGESVPISTGRDTTPVLRGETIATKPASEPASDVTAAKVPDRTGAAGGQEFYRTGKPQVETFAATATNTLRETDPNRVDLSTGDLATKREPGQPRTAPVTETRAERSGNDDALAIKLNEPVIEIPKAAETRATAPESTKIEPTRSDTGNRPVSVEPDPKTGTVDFSGSQRKDVPVTPVEPLARDIKEIATRGAEVLADKPVSDSQPDRPNQADRRDPKIPTLGDSADKGSGNQGDPVSRRETAAAPAKVPGDDIAATVRRDQGAPVVERTERTTGRTAVESFAATATNTLKDVDPNKVDLRTQSFAPERRNDTGGAGVERTAPRTDITAGKEPAADPQLAISLNKPVIEIPEAATKDSPRRGVQEVPAATTDRLAPQNADAKRGIQATEPEVRTAASGKDRDLTPGKNETFSTLPESHPKSKPIEQPPGFLNAAIPGNGDRTARTSGANEIKPLGREIQEIASKGTQIGDRTTLSRSAITAQGDDKAAPADLTPKRGVTSTASGDRVVADQKSQKTGEPEVGSKDRATRVQSLEADPLSGSGKPTRNNEVAAVSETAKEKLSRSAAFDGSINERGSEKPESTVRSGKGDMVPGNKVELEGKLSGNRIEVSSQPLKNTVDAKNLASLLRANPGQGESALARNISVKGQTQEAVSTLQTANKPIDSKSGSKLEISSKAAPAIEINAKSVLKTAVSQPGLESAAVAQNSAATKTVGRGLDNAVSPTGNTTRLDGRVSALIIGNSQITAEAVAATGKGNGLITRSLSNLETGKTTNFTIKNAEASGADGKSSTAKEVTVNGKRYAIDPVTLTTGLMIFSSIANANRRLDGKQAEAGQKGTSTDGVRDVKATVFNGTREVKLTIGRSLEGVGGQRPTLPGFSGDQTGLVPQRLTDVASIKGLKAGDFTITNPAKIDSIKGIAGKNLYVLDPLTGLLIVSAIRRIRPQENAANTAVDGAEKSSTGGRATQGRLFPHTSLAGQIRDLGQGRLVARVPLETPVRMPDSIAGQGKLVNSFTISNNFGIAKGEGAEKGLATRQFTIARPLKPDHRYAGLELVTALITASCIANRRRPLEAPRETGKTTGTSGLETALKSRSFDLTNIKDRATRHLDPSGNGSFKSTEFKLKLNDKDARLKLPESESAAPRTFKVLQGAKQVAVSALMMMVMNAGVRENGAQKLELIAETSINKQIRVDRDLSPALSTKTFTPMENGKSSISSPGSMVSESFRVQNQSQSPFLNPITQDVTVNNKGYVPVLSLQNQIVDLTGGGTNQDRNLQLPLDMVPDRLTRFAVTRESQGINLANNLTLTPFSYSTGEQANTAAAQESRNYYARSRFLYLGRQLSTSEKPEGNGDLDGTFGATIPFGSSGGGGSNKKQSQGSDPDKSSGGDRRRYKIAEGDTLPLIASLYLSDENLAWLIVEINQFRLKRHRIERKEVVELTLGQFIELPTWQEVEQFYLDKRHKQRDIEELVTIVLGKKDTGSMDRNLAGSLGIKETIIEDNKEDTKRTSIFEDLLPEIEIFG